MVRCAERIHARVSLGVLGRGRESFTTQMRQCSRSAVEGGTYCAQHAEINRRIAAEVARRKAAR